MCYWNRAVTIPTLLPFKPWNSLKNGVCSNQCWNISCLLEKKCSSWLWEIECKSRQTPSRRSELFLSLTLFLWEWLMYPLCFCRNCKGTIILFWFWAVLFISFGKYSHFVCIKFLKNKKNSTWFFSLLQHQNGRVNFWTYYFERTDNDIKVIFISKK